MGLFHLQYTLSSDPVLLPEVESEGEGEGEREGGGSTCSPPSHDIIGKMQTRFIRSMKGLSER